MYITYDGGDILIITKAVGEYLLVVQDLLDDGHIFTEMENGSLRVQDGEEVDLTFTNEADLSLWLNKQNL